jgi:hypothetical protein
VALQLTRADVLGARVRAQQLDRDAGTLADTAVLDLGVQDTGTDAGRWAPGYLRLHGPATPRQVADYLDAPVREVQRRWPADAVAVSVDGATRWLLAADAARAAAGPARTVRLLGPFDPYLRTRDRALLVPDPARAQDLWRVLGRPGGVLVDGAIAGTWRPRKAGRRLALQVELWDDVPTAVRAAIGEQAERLAACRGAELTGVDVSG